MRRGWRAWRARRAHRRPCRQHQTQLSRQSLRHTAKYCMYPFLSFSVSYCPYAVFDFSDDAPPPPATSKCVLHACAGLTSRILLHARTTLPRPTSQPANSRTTFIAAQPSRLLGPSHDKTPQRPIALANSYTTLAIPRDVPSNHHRRLNRSQAGLRICCCYCWRPALPGREIARVALLAAATKVLLCPTDVTCGRKAI